MIDCLVNIYRVLLARIYSKERLLSNNNCGCSAFVAYKILCIEQKLDAIIECLTTQDAATLKRLTDSLKKSNDELKSAVAKGSGATT